MIGVLAALGAAIASTGAAPVLSVVGTALLTAGPLLSADVTPGPSLYIDLFNLQWYQTLGMILAALGLSPAPWLLGLATNKIQFTAPAEKEKQRALDEQKRHYEALLTLERQRYADLEKSVDNLKTVAETQRKRAEYVTDAVLEIKDVVEANTHVLQSVHQVAREATGK